MFFSLKSRQFCTFFLLPVFGFPLLIVEVVDSLTVIFYNPLKTYRWIQIQEHLSFDLCRFRSKSLNINNVYCTIGICHLEICFIVHSSNGFPFILETWLQYIPRVNTYQRDVSLILQVKQSLVILTFYLGIKIFPRNDNPLGMIFWHDRSILIKVSCFLCILSAFYNSPAVATFNYVYFYTFLWIYPLWSSVRVYLLFFALW